MSRPFSWHSLRLRIPEDWEMTLYGRDAGCGSLEFSTLDGPRARISWAPSRKPLPIDGWEADEDGVYRKNGNDRRIWSWQFQETPSSLHEAILSQSAFSEEMAYTLGPIRARLPTGFALKDLTVYPGNLMLSAEADDRRRLVYRCWGLPDYVLKGKSLSAFFRSLLEAGGLRVESERTCCIREFEAVEVETSAPGLSPWERIRGRRARGRGWIWLDRDALRLHTFEQMGHQGAVLPEREDCFE